VTGVQGGGTTQSFGYDGDGNLTQAATNGITTTYSYNTSGTPNEVLTLATPGQPTTYYGYDTNGDTTSITNTGPISTGLRYDSQARLVGVTLQDGTSVSQSYNSAGQRAGYVVSKPGQPTLSETFQYRGEELGQAVVVTGTTTYTDTYLYTQDGLPLELLREQNGTTNRYWYVLDGRGNVVALTDTTGNVVDRYAYDVWGALTSVSESVPQRLRYAGYWYDQELGWYWVRVRMYDPSLKRWLQPDPSQADGVRTYAYVGDDPIDTTDPSGMDYCPGGSCHGQGPTPVPTPRPPVPVPPRPLPTPPPVKTYPTCRQAYPKLIPLSKLPSIYKYTSANEVKAAVERRFRVRDLERRNVEQATGGHAVDRVDMSLDSIIY
jgi:RHS repeat-associated protein